MSLALILLASRRSTLSLEKFVMSIALQKLRKENSGRHTKERNIKGRLLRAVSQCVALWVTSRALSNPANFNKNEQGSEFLLGRLSMSGLNGKPRLSHCYITTFLGDVEQHINKKVSSCTLFYDLHYLLSLFFTVNVWYLCLFCVWEEKCVLETLKGVI